MIITETLRDQLADTLLQINTRAVKCKTTLNQCWVRVSALSTDQQKICSRSWFVFESISQYFFFFFCLGIYKALSVSVSPWLAWAVHAGHIKWWNSDNAACFPWLSQHISSGSWNLVEPTFTFLFFFLFQKGHVSKSDRQYQKEAIFFHWSMLDCDTKWPNIWLTSLAIPFQNP